MTFDLVIKPVSGEFDLEKVEAYLLAMPHVARDPTDAHSFVSSYTRHGLAEAVERIAAGGGYTPSDIVIRVSPGHIQIAQMASSLETPRHFVAWLRRNCEVRFRDNDYCRDIPTVDDDLVTLFGEMDPPAVAIDYDGFEIINDPMGIAHDLITLLIDGLALQPSAGDVQLAPALRATWAGDAWRVARADLGETMVLTPAQIDELLRSARDVRHQARMHCFPIGATLDDGRYVVEDYHWGGLERGMACGRDRERDAPVMIAFGPLRPGAIEPLRQQLAYDVPGVVPLRHIGPLVLDGEVRYDGMVEDQLPDTGVPKLDAAAAARFGIALAEIVAAAHARGVVLVGLRPELVYTDGSRVTGVAPRGGPFELAMTPAADDVGCFSYCFIAPEVLARPDEAPTPAADVFSLAATIAFGHTWEWPYVGTDAANRAAIIAGERMPWSGDPKLGAILDRALAPVPKRIGLDELVSMLREVARG